MFSLVSGIYQSYFASPQVNLLVVGASGVGKTTLLERLKVTQLDTKPKPPPGASPTAFTDPPFRFLSPPPPPDNPSLPAEKEGDAKSPASAGATDSPAPPLAIVGPETTRPSHAISPLRRPLSWVCPAPPKYAKAAEDDDVEEEVVIQQYREPVQALNGVLHNHSESSKMMDPTPSPSLINRRGSTQGSMESVELEPEGGEATATSSSTATTTTAPQNDQQGMMPLGTTTPTPTKSNRPEEEQPQFDLKPKAKMLPLHKIRPTLGMNLAKIDMCGAKCHVWDLGGRLHHLWERYYDDCDAVIFVWKIPASPRPTTTTRPDSDHPPGDQDHDDDDDDDDPTEVTPELQMKLLEQVRGAIPDDVPLLVLAHVFGTLPPSCQTDVLYRTDRLLPHYHNPCQALVFAKATTGQGIRSAMEWLIPLAQRQIKIRERPLTDDVQKY